MRVFSAIVKKAEAMFILPRQTSRRGEFQQVGNPILNIISIVGARPQFIKAAAIARATAAFPQMRHTVLHTGQHYDQNMSEIFFSELEIPQPAHNIGVGSAPHGAQTGRMLEAIEQVLLQAIPDWVLVYGDTNSTLAGALAAVKLHIATAHIEAGLRSYNRRMLSVVCELDASTREQLKAKYPGVSFTGRVDQPFCDPNIAGVVIATPAATHGELVKQALLADKDVFVEKPLCLSVEEGKKLVALASARRRILMMSLHGISHDAWKRYAQEGSWYYEVLSPGFKYNLTDIAAAIGIEQLKKCNDFAAARSNVAAAYTKAFSSMPEIRAPVCAPENQHAWHLYVIQLQLEQLKITRDQFIEALKERGIGTSVHFIPLHLHPYYRDTFGYAPDDFPNATEAYRRIVSLPIYPRMSDADIGRVIEAVRDVAQQHRNP